MLGTGPGPILGKFCGAIKNNTRLAESTHNALTIWWHPGRRDEHERYEPNERLTKGFKLLWTAFRTTPKPGCMKSLL